VFKLKFKPFRGTDEEKIFLRKVRRFPKFYFASGVRSDISEMDIVKVKFVDENFMHYGLFQERLLNGEKVFFESIGITA